MAENEGIALGVVSRASGGICQVLLRFLINTDTLCEVIVANEFFCHDDQLRFVTV